MKQSKKELKSILGPSDSLHPLDNRKYGSGYLLIIIYLLILLLTIIFLTSCGNSSEPTAVRFTDSGWQLRVKMTVWDETGGISWCLLPLTEKGVIVTTGHEVAFLIINTNTYPPTEYNANCQEITWSVKIYKRNGESIPADGRMLWVGDFWRLAPGQYQAYATIFDFEGKNYQPFETLIVASYGY